MLVLGIESSCDETAAAIVADGERILSSVVASQVLEHQRFGGVVPELASREHLRKIVPIVAEACHVARVGLKDIEGIAVTEGPGLIGSLLVGLVYGKALALSLGKPLVGINHLEGHIHGVLLENKIARRQGQDVEKARFPNVTLVVSGGHTSLFLVEVQGPRSNDPSPALVPRAPSPQGRGWRSREAGEPGEGVSQGSGQSAVDSIIQAVDSGASASPKTRISSPDSLLPAASSLLPTTFSYTRLGQTRDDAAGEAFDKVAKLLALGYPGGPVLDHLARSGNPRALDFGRVRMKGNPLDFSFSGLKTAVLYKVRGTSLQVEAEQRRLWRESAGRATTEETLSHCSQATLDLIASFQNAVVTDLLARTLAAADSCRVSSVFVSGGVACNSLLRERFGEAARQTGLQVLFPSPALSTDNAAMIAAAGYYKLLAGQRADALLTAHASLPLGSSG
jgi:N6-L-threonylcarbamoyladenine synthase